MLSAAPFIRPSLTIIQTSMSQIEHLLQTAEAIRRDGKPEWMQVSLFSSYYPWYRCLHDYVGDWPRTRSR